jgi:hypothetical protein
MQLWEVYRPWCLKMSLSYLHPLVTVLSEHPFPLLEHVTFEGFDQVEYAFDARAQAADLEHTLEAVRNCLFDAAASLTGIPSTNERPIFNGYMNQPLPRHFDERGKDFEDMLNASFEAAVGGISLFPQVDI